MKIKVKPEDFRVKEILAEELREEGDYEVYLLHKRGTNTLDAIADLARRLRIRQDQISYCGLKDRHAETWQFIAIPRGKGKEIRAKNYETIFKGYLDEPLSPSMLKENRFEIRVREVATPTELVLAEIEDVQQHGFPNYYDVQRFGSARHGKGFVAHKIVLGQYKQALRLLLATPSPYDDAKTKAFRKCVKENWGDWEKCIHLAPTPWEKKILEFLSRRQLSKKTLKMCFGMVPPRMVEFLVNSFQSLIWNRVTAKLVEEEVPPERLIRVRYMYGHFVFYRQTPWNPPCRELPFPSPRIQLEPEIADPYNQVLKELGIEGIDKLRTTVKGWLFKSHRRELKIVPSLQYQNRWDPEHPGKQIWELEFALPPGAYATILIRRIFWKG